MPATPFQWAWAWAGVGFTLTASCCLMPWMYAEKIIEELARQDREDVKPPRLVVSDRRRS